MRRVNWTITERQHQELKEISRETGLSISELVRRALDKYIGLSGERASPPSQHESDGADSESQPPRPGQEREVQS